MHAAKPADNHVILNDHMARNGCRIDNNDPISQTRVMGDMAARHQQTVIANRGDAAAALGAKIDGHMLADGVALANLQLGHFAFKLQILRNFTNYGK